MAGGLSLLNDFRIQVAVAAVLIAIVCAVFVIRRKRVSQDELERQRRIAVNREGRLLDGYITEITDERIHFHYSVAGVDYQTTQTITDLKEFLPLEVHHVIGPVAVKYIARNPGNSIVVCEAWSGLRRRASTPSQEPIVKL
jgi:hypothetical protein